MVSGPLSQSHHLQGDERLFVDESPAGKITRWTYSGGLDNQTPDNNVLKAITYPDGSEIDFTYNVSPNSSSGLLMASSSWKPSGLGDDTAAKVTYYQYDSNDRIHLVINPDDNPTAPTHPLQYDYYPSGYIQTITDPEKRSATFTYGTAAGKTNLIVNCGS
jgi:YD repeat-containing protein